MTKLVRYVGDTKKGEPGIKTQPEHNITNQFVAFDDGMAAE